MHTLSTADHGCTPPRIVIPIPTNAADDLPRAQPRRRARQGRLHRRCRQLHLRPARCARASRCGNALRGTLRLARGDRVLMCVLDCIDFWRCSSARSRPGWCRSQSIRCSPNATTNMLDSGARAAVVSQALLVISPALPGRVPTLERLVSPVVATTTVDALLSAQSEQLEAVPTRATDPRFWLPTSGSTGAPKGTKHPRQPSIPAELYGTGGPGHPRTGRGSFGGVLLRLRPGNGPTFRFEDAILMASERAHAGCRFGLAKSTSPTSSTVCPRLLVHAQAHTGCPDRGRRDEAVAAPLRFEAPPEGVGRRWKECIVDIPTQHRSR